MSALGQNEIRITHGVISIFPFFIWRGRVVIEFDGKTYCRLLRRRFSKLKAKLDATQFAMSVSSGMQDQGFDEVEL